MIPFSLSVRQKLIKGIKGGGDDNTSTGITNSYGVDTGSKTYAGDTYAALTRQQWADYVSTFVPVENQLIKYASDPTVVSDAMTGASKDVNDAYTAQQDVSQRRLSGLGLSLNGDEQAAQTRASGLSRSLADVQAQNLARDATIQRQRSILGNPAPSTTTAGLIGG